MKAEAGRILSVHNLNLHIAVSVIRKDLIQVDCADKKNSLVVFSPPWSFFVQPPASSTKVAQTFAVIGVKNVDTMLIIKLEDAVILGPGQIDHNDILNFLIHFCIDLVIPSARKRGVVYTEDTNYPKEHRKEDCNGKPHYK